MAQCIDLCKISTGMGWNVSSDFTVTGLKISLSKSSLKISKKRPCEITTKVRKFADKMQHSYISLTYFVSCCLSPFFIFSYIKNI